MACAPAHPWPPDPPDPLASPLRPPPPPRPPLPSAPAPYKAGGAWGLRRTSRLLHLLTWIAFAASLVVAAADVDADVAALSPANWASLRQPSPRRTCEILSNGTIEDLCGRRRAERIDLMRRVLLLRRGCTSEADNLNLYQLLLLEGFGWETRSQTEITESSSCLDGGLDCLSEERGRCRQCFTALLGFRDMAEESFVYFNSSVLSQFQCGELDEALDDDNRYVHIHRFSSRFNCSTCAVAYQKWLLVVQSGDAGLWRWPACVGWCKNAELACPHIHSLRGSDYAGLPSFRCADPEIGSPDGRRLEPANCVEPCEVNIGGSSGRPLHCASACPKRGRDCQKQLPKDHCSGPPPNAAASPTAALLCLLLALAAALPAACPPPCPPSSSRARSRTLSRTLSVARTARPRRQF